MNSYSEMWGLYQRRLGGAAQLFRGRSIRMPLVVSLTTPNGVARFAYIPTKGDSTCFEYHFEAGNEPSSGEPRSVLSLGAHDPHHLLPIVPEAINKLLDLGTSLRDQMTDDMQRVADELEVLGT